MHNGWPPVAALGLVIHTISNVIFSEGYRTAISTPMSPALIAVYFGTLWTTLGSLIAGIPMIRIYEWFSIAVAFVVGPALIGWSGGGLRAIRLSAELGTSAAVGAVVIERWISPDLFGYLPALTNERVTALHYNANGGALFLLMGCAILAGCCLQPQGARRRGLDVILVIAGIWGLIQTGSRAALAGAVVAAVVTFLLGFKQQRAWSTAQLLARVAAAIAGLALGLILLAYTSEAALGRPVDSAALAGARSSVWDIAMDTIAEAPYFGASDVALLEGVGNAHNALLEAALRYGIPGAAIFLVVCVLVLVSLLRRARRPQERGKAMVGALLLIAVSIYGFAHAALIDNTYLWLVCAACSRNWSRETTGSREHSQ
jgi:O-antigen ligase